MASQALAGFTGQIYVRSAIGAPGAEFATTDKVAEMREVTINIERDSIDVSSHSSVGWKDFIGGLAQWTLDIDEIYVPNDAVQQLLYDAMINRTPLYFRLSPKGDAATENVDEVWEGLGVVLTFELTQPNDDAQMSKVNVQGQGALTRRGAGSGWGWP